MIYTSDVIVIGGGLVGSAVAYGLVRQGVKVSVLDEGDIAFRASRGNFGLVWVQSKGFGKPEYASWSLASSKIWHVLRDDLLNESGVDVQLKQHGGFHICLTEEEVEKRITNLQWLKDRVGGDYNFEMLDVKTARERLPFLGDEVAAVSYTTMDGHVNPLKLLRALHTASQKRGVNIYSNITVDDIKYENGVYSVTHDGKTWQAPKIVLSAGLGTKKLAACVGMEIPVRPQKGQVLITERVEPFLNYPTNYVRQTDEGTIQIGDSKEEEGYNDMVKAPVIGQIAARAIKCFPVLANARLVRSWGALRIMTPDGFPIYQESVTHPGAYVVTCHSGVTLAAQHAFTVAPWIAGGDIPSLLPAFSANRF